MTTSVVTLTLGSPYFKHFLNDLSPGVYELSPGTSDDGTSLLAGILQQRPRSRFTLSTILRHGWLRHIRRQDTTALLLPAITNRALSTQLPTHSQVSNRLLSAPEMSALNALTSLGVAPTSLDQYRAQGVRSAVGGKLFSLY